MAVFCAALLGALELTWHVPASCPGADEVQRHFARFAAARGDEVAVRAEAEVEQIADDRWRMILTIETSSGRETSDIEGERCDLLAEVAGLRAALATYPVEERVASPQAAVTSDVSEARDEEAPTIEAPPEPTPVSRSAKEKTAPARARGTLRLGGVVGAGALPRIDAGLVLMAGVAWPHARIDASGTFLFPQPARYDDEPDVGGNVLLGVAGLRGCGVPGWGPLSFPICAGIEAGALRGVGVGVPVTRTSLRAWLAASVGPGLLWSFHDRVGLWLEAALVVPILRPGFALDGHEDLVHRAAPASGRGSLGLEVRFP